MTAPLLELMIAGAPKAGTSSLVAYLGRHPEIAALERREISYFFGGDEYESGWENAYGFYFGEANGAKHVAKLAGLMYDDEAIARLRAHNPEIQVAVQLRNPVDRAFSAFLYARRRGFEDLDSFEAAIEAGPGRYSADRHRANMCSYIERGIYLPAVNALWDAFGRERVHVLLLEDMKESPASVYRPLFEALDVDTGFTPGHVEPRNVAASPRWPRLMRATTKWRTGRSAVRQVVPRHLRDRIRASVREKLEVQQTPPPMSGDMRARLVERFRPYNDQLGAALGRDLSMWNQ